MARQRPDEYVPELVIESTFGTEPTWTGQVVGSLSSVDLSSVRKPAIDDPSYTVDGGVHEKIVGLAHTEVSVAMSMKAEGLQISPAAAATAIPTFQSQMISLAMQKAANLTDTDTAAGTPTTASVNFTTAGSQDVTGIGIAAFEIAGSGTYEARPYTQATTTCTLLMATSAAPGVGDDILGAAQHQYTYRPSATRSASIRFVGNDSLQHRYLQGVVAGLSIPEFGPAELPSLDFTLKASGITQNPGADTRATPSTPRGKVWAGGELLIGAYGTATTPLAICGSRISVSLGGDYMPDECPNAASGVAGFYRGQGAVQVEVTFPHDVIPSAISGNSSASWYEAWETGGAESLFHLLFTVGQNIPGASQTWYFPKLRLVEVQNATVNEMDARKCIFVAATDLTATECQAVCALW